MHGAHGHGRLRRATEWLSTSGHSGRGVGEELAQAAAAGLDLPFGLERGADAVAGDELEQAQRQLRIGVQLLRERGSERARGAR